MPKLVLFSEELEEHTNNNQTHESHPQVKYLAREFKSQTQIIKIWPA